jgi:transposase
VSGRLPESLFRIGRLKSRRIALAFCASLWYCCVRVKRPSKSAAQKAECGFGFWKRSQCGVFRRPVSSIMPTKLSSIEIDTSKLEEALRRAEEKLDEKDYAILKAVVDAYDTITGLVDDKNTSIARLRKLLFGANTEKTKAVFDGMASIAPSSQAESSRPPASEEGSVDSTPNAENAAKTPRKNHGRNGADAYTGAEKVIVHHESLKPGDPCPKCDRGTVYETARPGVLVRIVGQSLIQAKIYELQKLRCNLCGVVFTPQSPKGVGAEKYDATAGSMIGLLKYGMGMTFNRNEKLQQSQGVPLPASTQWDIVAAKAERIEPAFEELMRQAADGDLLHNDDTTVKILEMMGKRAEQKSLVEDVMSDDDTSEKSLERRGLFTTGIVSSWEGRQIALFFSGRKHAGENLKDVLLRRTETLAAPIQMCDALTRNLPGELQTIVAHCLAHSRRRFVEVADRFPEECRYVLESLAVIYRNDASARERKLSPSARRHFHQAESGPTMESLHIWLGRQLEERLVEPNSSLGAAISYMLKHWERLTLFLRVPGAPLDNNVCERALKRAILLRKNALFYKTCNGSHVGDVYMSLIHTCALCGANPFDYLTEIDRHAAEMAAAPQNWMPWNYRELLDAPNPFPAASP